MAMLPSLLTTSLPQALSRVPESCFSNGESPGPLVGLEFWKEKMVDLGEILSQLQGPQITKVLKVLDLIRSPYYAAFSQLMIQVGGTWQLSRTFFYALLNFPGEYRSYRGERQRALPLGAAPALGDTQLD
jgi:hypothetical protein